MKFFLTITFISAVLLSFATQMEKEQKIPPPPHSPYDWIITYRQKIKNHFTRPENAYLIFSFIANDRSMISSYTKRAFKKINLQFLLSPSGIHLAGLLFCFNFFIQKIKNKLIKRLITVSILVLVFWIPQIYAVKRMALLRILFHLKYFLGKFTKWQVSLEQVFIIVFLFSFILGHFHASPLGFTYSFIFLGTFFSFRHASKFFLVLGLYSTQLLLALFSGDSVSLLSIPCGLLGGFLFTLLFPIIFIFLSTFWLFEINWIEPIVRLFVLYAHNAARILRGTYTFPSVFLLLFVWVLIFMPEISKKKYLFLILFLFLHTNITAAPSIFH